MHFFSKRVFLLELMLIGLVCPFVWKIIFLLGKAGGNFGFLTFDSFQSLDVQLTEVYLEMTLPVGGLTTKDCNKYFKLFVPNFKAFHFYFNFQSILNFKAFHFLF